MPLKKAGDPAAIYNMRKITMPEGVPMVSDNQTINMLDAMMFHIEKLKVDNYVKREPNFLFRKNDTSLSKRMSKAKSMKHGLSRRL